MAVGKRVKTSRIDRRAHKHTVAVARPLTSQKRLIVCAATQSGKPKSEGRIPEDDRTHRLGDGGPGAARQTSSLPPEFGIWPETRSGQLFQSLSCPLFRIPPPQR